MLRLIGRTSTSVGFTSTGGAQPHVARIIASRCLSTTPILNIKGARKRGQSKARLTRSKIKDVEGNEEPKASKRRSKKKSVASDESADTETTENASMRIGSGNWTTLEAKLQGMRSIRHSRAEVLEDHHGYDAVAGLYDPDQPVAGEEVPVDEGTKPKRETRKKRESTKKKETGKKREAGKKRETGKKKETDPKKKIEKDIPPLDVKTIQPQHLRLCPVEEDPSLPVPKLSYHLDKVLFNPGVYHMQDSRTGVFNFDPYLASIMPVDEFDFDALKSYITSSKDVKLRQLSATHGMKYCGSTSSMTSILSHFHFLLSAWRSPNFDYLSRSLEPESHNFTILSRSPSAAFAHFNDGVYALDSDKEYDTENILSMLGKSMEKLLTLPREEFEKYRRTRSHQISEEERNASEAFHYTTLGDFMMRSQLDAHDSRLPGSGMFDLKTRAVVAIRMDVRGYEKGRGYEIRNRFGQWESFEREYYDMIRTVFLKYSLQVRMGRMDGIFVAYHNTQRIFGFQYVSIEEMDHALHGTTDRRVGDQEFAASISLLNDLLNKASQRYPGRTLRLHVETRPTKVPLTYFFVEPVTEEEMQSTQAADKSSVKELEREIRDFSEAEAEAQSVDTEENERAEVEDSNELETQPVGLVHQNLQNEAAWETMMAKVEEMVEDESLGVGSVREAVQDALEQSGLLKDKTELETEQSLDAMVTSLTAHSSKIKELRDKSDSLSEDSEPKQDNAEVEGEGEGDSDAQTAPTTGNEESEYPPVEDSETPDASLTDLILRATEGIDTKAQNLRTFQRLFVDLTTQSKEPTQTSDGRVGIEEEEDELVEEEEGQEEEEGEEEEGEEGEVDASADTGSSDTPRREVLGMYVTVRNKVNGEYVNRPSNIDSNFDWNIEYTITELPDERAQKIYSSIKQRRKKAYAIDPAERAAEWHMMFAGRLPRLAKQGQQYREQRELQERDKPTFVAWDSKPLPPDGDVPPVEGTD